MKLIPVNKESYINIVPEAQVLLRHVNFDNVGTLADVDYVGLELNIQISVLIDRKPSFDLYFSVDFDNAWCEIFQRYPIIT